MSPLPSWAAKRDDVEPEIIAVFQEAGWGVWPLSGKGLPDLLVAPPGAACELVECKTNRAKLNADQKQWHDKWPGKKPHIVRNAAQARKLVRMYDGEPKTWPAESEDSPLDTPASSLRVEAKP